MGSRMKRFGPKDASSCLTTGPLALCYRLAAGRISAASSASTGLQFQACREGSFNGNTVGSSSRKMLD